MDLWTCVLLFVVGGFTLEANAQAKTCPDLDLPNGRVRIRGGGRMAYFRCKKRFRRVGHKLAVCLSSGTWSQQTPVCVGRGCADLGELPGLTVTELYKGGILQFSCPKGMRREGPQKIMCDGTNWDNQPPKCLYGVSGGCDFEDPSLCGWIQDQGDDFDWTWTSGGTPTSETGPDADHTTGEGHYIFMESSAPQKTGHVTRLLSPQYNPTTEDMCLSFWYHMKGPNKPGDVGDLDVYIRTESEGVISDYTSDDDDDDDASPPTTPTPTDLNIFHKEGYQGDDWIQGQAVIRPQNLLYRIVFAATRRDSWTGDIALDDIKVYNCSEGFPTATPRTVVSDDDGGDGDGDGDDSDMTTPNTKTSKPKKTTPMPTTTTTTKRTTTTTISPTTTTTMPTTQPTTTTIPSTTTPTTTTTTTTATTKTSTTTMPTTITMAESTTESDTTVHRSRVTLPSSYTTNADTFTTPSSTTSDFYDMPSTTTESDYYYDHLSTADSSSSSFSSTTPSTTEPGSGDTSKDYIEVNETSVSNSQSTTTADKNDLKNQPSTGSSAGGSSFSDYLPLIVGVSVAVAVGVAVVGALAWMWRRNKQKKKALEVEEDQLNIIGSIEPSAFAYPPSNSVH